MSHRGFTVHALAEVAIQCIDLDAMVAFCGDVIGLDPLNDPDTDRIIFFLIAEGFSDHTKVLALLRHDIEGAGQPRRGDSPC